MSKAEKRARGTRLAALRHAVFGEDFSQEKLGKEAGIPRVAMVKMEGGDNAMTGAKIQEGLAHAFGIDVPSMAAYLDGRISIETVRVLRQSESILLTKDVIREVKARPNRWHAGTLLMAADHVRHLKGSPEGGIVRFLDELEMGVPTGSSKQAEDLASDILKTAPAKRARR